MNQTKINKQAESSKSRQILFEFEGRKLTFGEQKQRAAALLLWLEQNDLGFGSQLVVATTDELEYASLALALVSCGRTPIIFDTDSTASEANRVLVGITVDGIIADKSIAHRWGLNTETTPYLEIGSTSPKGMFSGLLKKRKETIETKTWPLTHGSKDEFTTPSFSEQTLAYIIFTSGTTSRPKGVELTHRALDSQLSTLVRQYGLSSTSNILNTLPMHHADGLLQGPILAWYSGATVHRPCAFTVANLQRYLDSIYRDRITHFIAVPTMLSLIHRLGLEWKDNFTSEDFRFIVSCAGHLETELWTGLERDLGMPVVNLYGLTETGTSALFNGPDPNSRRVGTLGKPVNSEIKIVDQNAQEVTQGETGELLIRSEQLMRGYHNDPEATQAALQDGWLLTGDLVRELESGHISLVGRKKNQIISGGRNISPEEVNSVLLTHPTVTEAVVFGQHEVDWGEKVVALVVSTGEQQDSQELIEWCRIHLSEYKIPKEIRFTAELPKGPSGKVRLQEARKLFDGQNSDTKNEGEISVSLQAKVLQVAAKIFKTDQAVLSPTSSPENTQGWDSLAHMELILALEEAFGIRLSAKEIMQLSTLGNAEKIISAKVHQ